jgi:hypothetical protein
MGISFDLVQRRHEQAYENYDNAHNGQQLDNRKCRSSIGLFGG